MSKSQPSFLWRETPTPRSLTDTCELQTLAFDNNTRKPEWVTVASGAPVAIAKLARHLNATHYRMFPLHEGEVARFAAGGLPGDPRSQDAGGEPSKEDSENGGEPSSGSALGRDEAPPSISGDAIFGSTPTTIRRPAIREEHPRRALRGAARIAAEKKRQREGRPDGDERQ